MVSGTHVGQMPASLADADISMLYNSQPERLDLSALVRTANAGNSEAKVVEFTQIDQLLKRLQMVVSAGDIVVCMSNGSFAGIHGQILTMLNKTAAT